MNRFLKSAAGVSRSVTITCAYLMYKKQLSVNVALEIISQFRRCASPNTGFIEQLQKYEPLVVQSNIKTGKTSDSVQRGQMFKELKEKKRG